MKLALVALVALTIFAGASVRGATLYPYLAPVRAEVARQLNQATNGTPADAKLATILQRALRALDPLGPGTLMGDLKLLRVVGTALCNTSISDAFAGPLDSAINSYLLVLFDDAARSEDALATASPSNERAAAQRSLESAYLLLDAADQTPDLRRAPRLLVRAANRLAVTARLVSKATAAKPSTAGATGVVSSGADGELRWAFSTTSATTPGTSRPVRDGTGGTGGGGLSADVSGSSSNWNYMIRWPSP
jgi:hypothetical protein